MEYKPVSSLTKMTQNSLVWALIGLIFGLVMNWLSIKVFKQLDITNKYVKIFLQLLLISVAISYVHTSANNYFGWTWQNVTEGLFFVSLFFGVQFDLYSNIQSIGFDL
jgi:uncharacterized protein YacL